MGSLTPIFSHFCFSFHSKSQFIVVMPPVCNKRYLALSLFYLPFASNISLHAVQMWNGQKSPHGKCSLRSSETEQHTIAASRISLCISNITAHGLLSEISVRTFNTGFACCVSTIVFSSPLKMYMVQRTTPSDQSKSTQSRLLINSLKIWTKLLSGFVRFIFFVVWMNCRTEMKMKEEMDWEREREGKTGFFLLEIPLLICYSLSRILCHVTFRGCSYCFFLFENGVFRPELKIVSLLDLQLTFKTIFHRNCVVEPN